ncbi:hypothetical protein [Methylicorpusculum oleiharenae]|nr:hypothetical protein [Methylicorpusculum oleiharenae]
MISDLLDRSITLYDEALAGNAALIQAYLAISHFGDDMFSFDDD